MKKLAIIFAVIALSLNVAMADNVKPLSSSKASIAHNGFNLLEVSVDKQEKEVARVSIYDTDFTLLHSTSMSKKDVTRFDISQLKKGNYIVKIEIAGENVFTGTFEKIK